MNTAPVILLPLTNMTNADVISNPQTVQNYSGYSVQAIWTGNLAGFVQVEASLDYNPGGALVGSNGQPFNAGTWDIVAAQVQPLGGAGGSFIWNVWPAMYDFFRIHFIYSSGSGTVRALARIKG